MSTSANIDTEKRTGISNFNIMLVPFNVTSEISNVTDRHMIDGDPSSS